MKNDSANVSLIKHLNDDFESMMLNFEINTFFRPSSIFLASENFFPRGILHFIRTPIQKMINSEVYNIFFRFLISLDEFLSFN